MNAFLCQKDSQKVFLIFSLSPFLCPEMHWKKSPQKVLIGFFSVASKLTGVFQDDLAITALLHDYGALAIWDYNTAAPYATIDMNPYVRLLYETLGSFDFAFSISQSNWI